MMTRKEQLEICSLCKNKKMDMQQGMLCGLTNAKADFEYTCPNYDDDVEEIEKIERQEDEDNQPQKTISGWLAFFLWVGVGLGAIGSCVMAIAELVDAGLSLVTSLIYAIYLGSLLITAILTIRAFNKRSPNAVALAKTYIAMIAIDGLFNVANYFILDDSSMLVGTLRSFVWAIVWFVYLSVSEQVETIIPRATRVWKKAEKILLALYVVATLCLVSGMAYFTNNPSESGFYEKDYLIDLAIKNANKELPDYSSPIVTTMEMTKDKDNIIYSYKFREIDGKLDANTAWGMALVLKQELLAEVSQEKDQDVIDLMNLFFNGGYNLCYRYMNSKGEDLYNIIITGEEYRNAHKAGDDFRCNAEDYQAVVDYYVSLLPFDNGLNGKVVDIRHTTNTLEYYVKLPEVDASLLFIYDEKILRESVMEQCAESDDYMKILAGINKEDIIYYFYRADGEEHAVIALSYEEYASLAE